MIVVDIDGVTGLRDVGGIAAASGRVREGVLYRSGHLADLTPAAAQRLRERIRRVIDLRTDDEAAAQPSALLGVPVVRVPLYHGSTRSYFEQDYDLPGVYRHLLGGSAVELTAAVRALSHGGPTLVHCTIGKDRTGLTVALALAAVEADRDAIVADYALTAGLIPAEHRRATADRIRRTYPTSVHAASLVGESPAEAMAATLADVDARWGSAAGFLTAHGLTDAELAALHDALIEH